MLTLRPQCLSPQMIILRVLMGRAWTKDSLTTGTGISFPTTSGQRMSRPLTYTASGTAINMETVSKEGSFSGSESKV